MNEAASLTKRIECSRRELNSLSQRLGNDHPEVLAKSQQLDELIVQYMLCKTKKSTT